MHQKSHLYPPVLLLHPLTKDTYIQSKPFIQKNFSIKMWSFFLKGIPFVTWHHLCTVLAPGWCSAPSMDFLSCKSRVCLHVMGCWDLTLQIAAYCGGISSSVCLRIVGHSASDLPVSASQWICRISNKGGCYCYWLAYTFIWSPFAWSLKYALCPGGLCMNLLLHVWM